MFPPWFTAPQPRHTRGDKMVDRNPVQSKFKRSQNLGAISGIAFKLAQINHSICQSVPNLKKKSFSTVTQTQLLGFLHGVLMLRDTWHQAVNIKCKCIYSEHAYTPV